MDWSNEEETLREFPERDYVRMAVTSGEDAQQKVCEYVWNSSSSEAVFGETRWFAPGRGMTFIRRPPAKDSLEAIAPVEISIIELHTTNLADLEAAFAKAQLLFVTEKLSEDQSAVLARALDQAEERLSRLRGKKNIFARVWKFLMG